MNNRPYAILPAIFALLILLAACSAGPYIPTSTASSTSTLDGATLVQERCTICHPLSRVESARYTAAEWKTVVDIMIARGAQLTPDEETVVVNYLAKNYGN